MNYFEQLKQVREETVEKWNKFGFLAHPSESAGGTRTHCIKTIDIKDIRKKKLNQINNFISVDNTYVPTNNDDFSAIQFPIVKRVLAKTLGGGGWIKSEKQQLKENRLNKLRVRKNIEKYDIIKKTDKYHTS